MPLSHSRATANERSMFVPFLPAAESGRGGGVAGRGLCLQGPPDKREMIRLLGVIFNGGTTGGAALLSRLGLYHDVQLRIAVIVDHVLPDAV
jgi:hypothetical protein